MLVPAFAVDPTGNRLGRGGGSYDRALARLPARTPVAALLYADELLPEVPVESWDLPVTSVVTPDGWHDLTAAEHRTQDPSGRGNSRCRTIVGSHRVRVPTSRPAQHDEEPDIDADLPIRLYQ